MAFFKRHAAAELLIELVGLLAEGESAEPRSEPKKTTSLALGLTPSCFSTALKRTPVNRPQDDRPWIARGLLPEHSKP